MIRNITSTRMNNDAECCLAQVRDSSVSCGLDLVEVENNAHSVPNAAIHSQILDNKCMHALNSNTMTKIKKILFVPHVVSSVAYCIP